MTDHDFILHNARIVLADRVTETDEWVRVQNGKFTEIGNGPFPHAKDMIDAKGGYVFPGLIDLQINGGGGLNFNDCKSIADVATILDANLACGTTGVLATFITNTPERLGECINRVAGMTPRSGATLLGFHVEGPFFNVEKRGMHAPDKVSLPSIEITKDLLEAGRGQIKIMTLAPELPKALDVIRFLKSQNVIASMGHTMASYDEAETAIAAGATMATHLFNVMAPLHHRKPGLIPALLNSALHIGVIADGEHIDDAILRMIFKIDGPNYFLVSDAIAPLGTTTDHFDYHGTTANVKNGVCYMPDNTIAASVTPLLIDVVRTHTKIGLDLVQAVKMASLTPAEIIGVDQNFGSIAIGKHADFLILDQDFQLQSVYKNGERFSRVFNLAS